MQGTEATLGKACWEGALKTKTTNRFLYKKWRWSSRIAMGNLIEGMKILQEVDILHRMWMGRKVARWFCLLVNTGATSLSYKKCQGETYTSITRKFSVGDFWSPRLRTGVANTKMGSLIDSNGMIGSWKNRGPEAVLYIRNNVGAMFIISGLVAVAVKRLWLVELCGDD